MREGKREGRMGEEEEGKERGVGGRKIERDRKG